ncbi:hypothetical protein ACMDCT_10525 [Halomonadaceae bacterium KBTZ08]
MKTRLSLRAYHAPLAIVLTLPLAGCNLDNSTMDGAPGSCAESFNVEDPSQVEYSSLTIDGDPQSNPEQANLDRTLFRPFARIAKPAQTADQKAADAYAFFGQQTEAFIGFDKANLPGYDKVRNGFDLLEAMAASGNVAPLQTAREAMANCVREDAPGSLIINSLKVTEQAAASEGDDDERESWELGVNYAHNPEPLSAPTPFGPNIARVAFTPESFVFTLYPNQAFEGIGPASGFKQPTKLIAGFNADFEETLNEEENSGDSSDSGDSGDSNEEGDNGSPDSVIFESFLANTQDDRGEERGQTDRWSWSSEEGTDAFNSVSGIDTAQCVRITADYAGDVTGDRITVELDTEPCPRINDPSDFEAETSFTYQSASPDTQQERD